MNASTRLLDASSPELPLGLLAARACEDLAASSSSCSPKTRIGPSDVFGETRTEPLAFLTSTSHRACGVSWLEVASDLFLFSQEDPTGFTDGMHLYTYVSSDPANFIDPSGLGKVGWFVRTVKGVWKRVGKKAAERCLASGKDVKVVGRGSSGDARTMAKRRFGAKTDRHDPHPGYKNSHYQHKNGGQGHVFYRGAKALTAVGILGEHWYSDVIDFFNPISDGVEAGEMINEVVDAAFDVEDDCGCQ